MLERVVDEVGHDPLEPPRVAGHAQAVAFEPHAAVPAARPHRRPHERRDVDLLGVDALGARVEAGDLHQVLDQLAQAADVRDQQLGRPPRLGRHPVEVAGQQRGLAHQRGQRRPQLVRDVGREAALPRLRSLQLADLRLQRGGHLVERLRPGAELVPALHRQPRLEQALGQRLRRAAGPRHRPERTAREHDSRECRQQHEDPDPAEQHVAQHRQLVPQAVLGEEEVELPPVRGGSAGDEEPVARDGRALVAELAAPDDLSQAGGHRAQRDARAGEERLAAASGDREKVASAFVRVDELARVAVGRRDGEVPPRLHDARVDRVREQVVPDEEVRARRQRDPRQAHRQREHEGEPATEGHEPASKR